MVFKKFQEEKKILYSFYKYEFLAMFAYNLVIMRKFGSDGVTALTIVGYVAYVFSMIVVGFG